MWDYPTAKNIQLVQNLPLFAHYWHPRVWYPQNWESKRALDGSMAENLGVNKEKSCHGG